MVEIIAYMILIGWIVFAVLIPGAINLTEDSRAKNKAKNYFAYGLIISIILALIFFWVEPLDNDFQNIIAYMVFLHLILIVYHYITFTSRYYKRRKKLYGWFFLSMVLGSTAVMLLSLEVAKHLSVGL